MENMQPVISPSISLHWDVNHENLQSPDRGAMISLCSVWVFGSSLIFLVLTKPCSFSR